MLMEGVNPDGTLIEIDPGHIACEAALTARLEQFLSTIPFPLHHFYTAPGRYTYTHDDRLTAYKAEAYRQYLDGNDYSAIAQSFFVSSRIIEQWIQAIPV